MSIAQLKVDPVPLLAASENAAISYFARRDLQGQRVAPASSLWQLPGARRILRRQRPDGSWRYPGAAGSIRSRRGYDQLETFRQLGILVEKFGFTRRHPPLARAAEFLLSSQTGEGDLRGIYGSQYATTYVGAMLELLVKAGYARDERVGRCFRWLLSVRQHDGGWAIPWRTSDKAMPYAEAARRRSPLAPDTSKPSSHLVTGMVLRAFAADPARRRSAAALRAAELLAARLYTSDLYVDRADAAYWERVSFPFWFTDVVSALDSLSRIGVRPDRPEIAAALRRLSETQRPDGTFALKLLRDADRWLPWWICLAICRSLGRWQEQGLGPRSPARHAAAAARDSGAGSRALGVAPPR